MGVIKGDTWSLDYGSSDSLLVPGVAPKVEHPLPL